MRYRFFLPSLYWGFPKLQSVTHLRWLLPLIPADPHCLGGVTPVWFGMVSYLIVWYADPLCLGGITPGPANTGERDHRQQKIFLYGRYFFIRRLFSFPHHSKSCLLQYEVTLAKSSSRSSCSSKNGLFLTLRRAVPGQATGSTD